MVRVDAAFYNCCYGNCNSSQSCSVFGNPDVVDVVKVGTVVIIIAVKVVVAVDVVAAVAPIK